MRRVLKWVGVIVGVLLLVIIIAGVVLYILGNRALNKSFDDVTVEAITIPTDEDSLARGQHLAEAVTLCVGCHGDDLGGDEFIDDAVFGSGDAPNLTSGEGGVAGNYQSTEDWVRALRHGVKPNGDGVVFMPSQHYYIMSDEDLGAVIAYVQSVPPVDRETKDLSLSPVGTIIAGVMMGLPADDIDHDAERPVAPEPGVTAEYGEYLTTLASCSDCHGDKLDGSGPPGMPSGPDLTSDGDVEGWSEQDFVNTIRQGVNPDGDVLDSDEMPWDYYTRMSDEELGAIWAYLQTLD